MNKYKSFIPSQVFDTQTEEWEEVNPDRNNWIEYGYKEYHKSIIQFTPDLIMVIFTYNDIENYPVSCMYRGILE